MTNKIINNRREKMKNIVLLVRYTTKSGMRGKFVEAVMASGILDQIRKEKGCVSYNYYEDVEDPDKLLLVEEWESEEDQQKHLQMPHMDGYEATRCIRALGRSDA
jgi:quinol monooxygenase YgiN